MQTTKITDVFFDLDHTLWDFDRNSALAFERVFKKNEIVIDLKDFIKAYEPINFEYWKLFREEKVSKEQLRRGRLIDTFQKFEIAYENEMIDGLAVSYKDELPLDNHLFDGAIDLLDYLKVNYDLHIITNGFHEVQHLKLRNSGILSYFKTITTSDEVGVKKPNPLVFKKALQKANVEAGRSIMIGDTFEADILGAEAVGMQTLFYNYRKDKINDTYLTVADIKEIKLFL